MTALTEERKQQIIEEEPGGIWLVLNEEYDRDMSPVADLHDSNPNDGGE